MIKWKSQTVYSEIKYISFEILEKPYKLWKIFILQSCYRIFDGLMEENGFKNLSFLH